MAYDPFDDFFKQFRRMFKEFDSEFAKFDVEKFEREFESRPGVTGFKIEIRDHGDGKPAIKVSRLDERPEIKPAVKPPEVRRKPQAEIEAKPIKCMLETNVAKVEKLDEVLLTVHAPEVKKDDVEVRQLGRALEVIARKPSGEAYFAAFELPSDAQPSDYRLDMKDGMLVIRVPRRKRVYHAGVR
ncbi:MAG: Hsp20/alpha crystallin family protein [Candidatus Hadarchaeum sp.]|nr:Hsp20/alpha crystallin family protein [Candidatus Hadarchaeum sp.]